MPTSKSDAALRKEYEEYLKYVKSQGGEVPEDIEAPVEAKAPKYSDGLLETALDMATVIPQGVTTWADEAQAGIQAAVKAPLEERSFQEIYDQDVADIRNRISLARERSPWATTATEMGTGIATSFVPGAGAGKLGSALGTVGRAAIEGLGTAEDKMSMEGLVQTGIGAGLGAGGALVSGGLKKVTTGDANKIRANVLGARTSEFKEIGIKEREKIADELNKMGLFKNVKVDFDVNQGKFVPKGKSLENLEKPARDKIKDRLDSALEKIQSEKIRVLGRHLNDPVDLAVIEDELEKVAQAYASKGTGMKGRLADAQAIKDTILEDIAEEMQAKGMTDATIELLENAKLRLSEDVGNYGRNPLLQKTPENARIYQSMYSTINKNLRASVGNNKYAQFNDMQQKMLTAKSDLAKALASEEAQRTQAGWGGMFNKIANETLGSPEAGLGIARGAEISNMPGLKQLKTPARLGVAEAPFQAMRFLDPSIPSTPEIPMAPEESSAGYNFSGVKPAFSGPHPRDMKRNPQSVGLDMTPMEVAKARLPRTTEGLLQNKELVIAKLAVNGVPDEMIDTVTQALNEDPESLDSIAAMVAMQFPSIFAKSKYNMFDGKILDPQERAKAADETSKRDDMDSLKKAKIINELNKSGKWLGE
jgi:hypothetical protein